MYMLQSGQVECPPPPPPKDYINEFIIQKLNLLVFVDFISAFPYVHWALNSHEAVIKFLSAQIPRMWCKSPQSNFNFQRFSVWPDTEKFLSNIHCSLRMQECPFEFDTSYRNDYQIHFSNNHFINRILWVYLPWLENFLT